MHSQINGFFYTILDGEHFEPPGTYRPTRELVEIVEEHAGAGRISAERGFWAYYRPESYPLPAQGWKIHISAHPGTAMAVLRKVAPLLVDDQACFKFASDLKVIGLMTNKNWPRTGSGKFITVYPRDLGHFKRLIEACRQALEDFQGPHIFTDRPYRGSKSVYYRYGGFQPIEIQTPHGDRVPALKTPDGRLVADERKPYFEPPPWESDPFPPDDEEDAGGSAELNGRYRVEASMRFSNRGGIYRGVDLETGRKVVIKEARPGVDANFEGKDSRDALRHEAMILQKLEPTGLAPRFIDLFQEWDHWFLVEEYLDGETFFGHSMNRTLAFTHYKEAGKRTHYRRLLEMTGKLVEALEKLHAARVVLRDLTKDNVILMPDGSIRLIDFELSFDLDQTHLVQGHTRGYASPQQLKNARPTIEEDHYALGALLFDFLFFTTSLLHMDPGAAPRFLRELRTDNDWPKAVEEAILGLMHPDVESRWTPRQAYEHLQRAEAEIRDDSMVVETRPADLSARIEATLEGVRRYLENTADYQRKDRLWPTNPRVFSTNPVNIQYGACGTAWFFLRAQGHVPARVLDWIEARLDEHALPIGLYNGSSGVAWFLWEAGRRQRALELFESTAQHPALLEIPDLMYGAAGWGIANLHFWKRTGQPKYLDRARFAARHLLETAELSKEGLSWKIENVNYVGLPHGSSGVALFLLYLHLATGDASYLEPALRALDFELAHAVRAEDKLWWRRMVGSKDDGKFPHWRLGSAGVGVALLRAYRVTGDPRWLEEANRCANACGSKWANKIWQNYGLAGFGELHLDFHQILGDRERLENARRLAQGTLLFQLQRPEGIAFPGIELLRISADYGSGMAGVGLFLQRVLNPELPRLLALDELLETSAAPTEQVKDLALAGA